MSTNDASARVLEQPALSRAEVNDLLTFLGANVDVARADGKDTAAGRFAALLATAKTLTAHAQLAGVIR